MSETQVQQRTARSVADELLAAVDAQRFAELRQLALVGELVDCYDHVDSALIEGAPRLVPSGGDGTPLVDEFLVKELAPLLRVSEATAWQLIRDAVNLRDRHPQTWFTVQLGQGQVWQARQIARACADLSAEAAAWVDDRVGPALGHLPWARLQRKLAGHIVTADKELARAKRERARRHRFVQIRHTGEGTSWLVALLSTPDAVALDHAIGAISRDLLSEPAYPGTPDEARAQALGILATPADAPAARPVRPAADVHRSAEATASAGSTTVPPRSKLPRPEATLVVHVSSQTLDEWTGTAPPPPPKCASSVRSSDTSGRPEDPRGPGDGGSGRRLLRTPGRTGQGRHAGKVVRSASRARQAVRCYRSIEFGTPGVARAQGPRGLVGIGPLLADQVRDLLGHTRVRVLPVLDLDGDPAVDAYEIPDKIRTHTVIRDGHSVFPFATRQAAGCDLDHTIPFHTNPDGTAPPGQTRPSNLGALDRSSHRAKTHAGWQVEQPRPGVFEWISPLGYHYRVDDQGSGRKPRVIEESFQFDASPDQRP